MGRAHANLLNMATAGLTLDLLADLGDQLAEHLPQSSDPDRALTREQMRDNISVYWFTGTPASSARMYWENRDRTDAAPIAVPAGVSVFPKEIITVSRRMAETRYRDLRWFSRLDRGGHFAAWEQPELFVDELRSFFRTVR